VILLLVRVCRMNMRAMLGEKLRETLNRPKYYGTTKRDYEGQSDDRYMNQ